MATDTAAIKYASRATYGSVAYDLNRLYGTAAPQIAVERPAEIPSVRPEERTKVRPRTAVRTEQRISLVSVAGFLAVAVLAVFMLLGYIQLNEVADHTAKLESTLSQLNTDEAKLLVAYEHAFNLTEVEEYARSVLGMKYPSDRQITYLHTEKESKGVILDSASGAGETTVKDFTSFLNSLLEYFK